MPMEDTYGIQSRIDSIIVVERWYCCRGSPVFSDRNIHSEIYTFVETIYQGWRVTFLFMRYNEFFC